MPLNTLVGYTTDRELHPAPKTVFVILLQLYCDKMGMRGAPMNFLFPSYKLW